MKQLLGFRELRSITSFQKYLGTFYWKEEFNSKHTKTIKNCDLPFASPSQEKPTVFYLTSNIFVQHQTGQTSPETVLTDTQHDPLSVKVPKVYEDFYLMSTPLGSPF